MRILPVDNKVNDQFRFETLAARATSQARPGPGLSVLLFTLLTILNWSGKKTKKILLVDM